MPTLLKDIPTGQLTPDEVETIANEEFDYADRERVSMREARRATKERHNDEITRRNLMEINRVFGTDFETHDPYSQPGVLTEGPGEFTFKEKVFEVTQAGHRGLGSLVKLPGIFLKALGESAPTRKELEAMRISPNAFQRYRANIYDSPMGKAEKEAANRMRKAGNWYIDYVNGMMTDESPKSRIARQNSFMSAPIFRTAMAVGESAPSYGVAIAATLTSGNPNIGLLVLGTTSASSAYENLRQQNVDPDLALIGALVVGSIEMLTEKIPMDILMKGGARPFLKRALHLGTAEAFQELFAQLGQNYVEAVVKDVDPENYATVLQAARQEWSIISQGWEDAMAAGFAMGSGAAVVSPRPDLGRTKEEMLQRYGVIPRNTGELMHLMERVRQEVKKVEAQPEGEVVKEAKEKKLIPAPMGRIKAEKNKTGKYEIKMGRNAPDNPFNNEIFTGEFQTAQIARKSYEAWFLQQQTQPAKPEEEVAEPAPIVFGATPLQEIGEGEEKPRGTSLNVMAQAIEDELVREHESLYDELPQYRAMNMKEQAEKAATLIEDDLEKAKRVAFYKEPAPPDLYPENVFTGLRVFATANADIDLLMDLALNEDVVREHTVMGKRIKSLDTDQDYADPIRAIREVVEARKENMARKGKDVSALEAKLRDLQAALDKTQKARAVFTKKAQREYGNKNTLVTRTEYDTIIVRRKKEAKALKHDPRLGAVYVPGAKDFTDMAKIGLFHLEAMGRDFAKWSYQMTRDLGEWVTPHLAGEYDKALKEAKKRGVDIKESKRLTTKKKRLITTTQKIEEKFEEQDFARIPRIPIELDEEGRKLQAEYDLAREKYKVAQTVANIITEKEVRIIAQLAKDAAERRVVMEQSERRKEGKAATETELEYGIALSMFLEYVSDLKTEASKKSFKEVLKGYLTNPVDFISDFAGTLKAAKASLDNSFLLRQGLPTFLKGITGHVPSAKIWWKTFMKSWKLMWQTLHKQKVMQGLFAEMVSDPDYNLLKKAKVALNVIEEEIPVDIPSRIPLVGMLFRMGENAFVGSSRYMRYQLAKQYLSVWRKSGVELNKMQLESLGRLANSQTGRGDTGSRSQRPGLINNLLWSPRNLRAYVDILTLHLFDRNFTAFARKQAAINLVHYISGAAMILAMAKWVDDDSVTWDPNSADFGKIKIGNTRFSVGGGAAVLVVLASRLVSRKFTSSATGETKSIDSGKFGALGGKDLVWNFLENKLSPASQMAVSVIDRVTWDGNQLTIPQMVDDALTPLIIQNVIETGSVEDSANVLAALIAEALGVNVQTYAGKQKRKTKARTE